MEDFFKNIKDNLENRPEPAFDKRAWRKVEKNLDGQEGKPRRGIVGWWMPAALLLLLGLNAFLLFKLNDNKKIITSNNTIDTLVQKQIIYVTDTIYKTKTITEETIKYIPANEALARQPFILPTINNKLFEKQKPDIISSLNNNFQSPFVRIFQNKNNIEKPSANEETKTIDLTNYDAGKIGLLALQELVSEPSGLPNIATEPFIKKQKKSLRYYLHTMRPKSFNLGINGGMVFPLNDDFHTSPGYSFGLTAFVEFSPNISLWLDAAHVEYTYEAKQMGDNIGVPSIDPPSDDFDFVVAEVPQPARQYFAGMQYVFNAKGKLKPFVGAGTGLVVKLPYEVTYDFKNNSQNITVASEVIVNKKETLSGFAHLHIGLEYVFANKWSWLLQSNYRTNWENMGIKSPTLLEIQGGLKYRF